MIDHTTLETAYKAYSKWVTSYACKLYRTDPDRMVSDTWSRVWFARERLDRIDPGLLKVIMMGLFRDYLRDARNEQRRLEKWSRTPHHGREPAKLPEIDPDALPEGDRSLYLRLQEYANSTMSLEDTRIPHSTLFGFRRRMRKRFNRTPQETES